MEGEWKGCVEKPIMLVFWGKKRRINGEKSRKREENDEIEDKVWPDLAIENSARSDGCQG
ncbi:hypothetical protein CCACVL1_16475 [Corchorus capsularis]|uniref:Uncharacterized protein n=1 Tax=Corchorus capsularis TaxID=210143 RepID=A0A1R3HWP8_COCAP|nr:hypothetical protein CCACVL1_16475 [Corchorus capsularis]